MPTLTIQITEHVYRGMQIAIMKLYPWPILNDCAHLSIEQVHVYGVHVYGVHVYGVHVYGVHVYGVHVYGVHVYGVLVYGVHVYGVHVYGVLVYGVHVYGVLVYGVHVYGVHVYGVHVYGVHVYGVHVYGVHVYGVHVYGVGCTELLQEVSCYNSYGTYTESTPQGRKYHSDSSIGVAFTQSILYGTKFWWGKIQANQPFQSFSKENVS